MVFHRKFIKLILNWKYLLILIKNNIVMYNKDFVCEYLIFYLQNYLIELLIILVEAHHPGGAVQGCDEALACDWVIWRRHLLAIYCLVQKELYNYQNSRRSNYRLEENFITLAVAVMKQVNICII